MTASLPAVPEHAGYCLAACGARIDLATNRDGRCGRCIADRSSRCAICQACGDASSEHEDAGHAFLGLEAARVAPPKPATVPPPPTVAQHTARVAEVVAAMRPVSPPAQAAPRRPTSPPPTTPALPAPEEITMATNCNDPEGCDAPAVSKGKCGKHYQRWLKAGKPGDASAPSNPAPKAKAQPLKQLELAGTPPSRQVITRELAEQLTLEELEICLGAAEAKLQRALAMRDRLRAFGTAPTSAPAAPVSSQIPLPVS